MVGSGLPRLVFYSELSASLSLYLDGLPSELAAQIAVLPPRRLDADFLMLAGAGLVIFVRGFEQVWHSGLLAALERIGVPCAWFTDDDLTALRREQPGFGFYSQPRVHEFAAHMVALIGSTPALCDRLSAYHQNVLHWPCVLNEKLLAAFPQGDQCGMKIFPRIAFVGGSFRVEGLKSLVLQALETLPRSQLVVVDGPAAKISGAWVLPFERDFNCFISAWRAVSPDILVHPPGQSRNIVNKGPGILLTALYLGAAPIVGDEAAFQGLGADDGVLRAGNASDWRSALAEFAVPDARRKYLARLLAYARVAWAPGRPQTVMDALLVHAAPDGDAALMRQSSASALGWRPPASFMWGSRLRRFASRYR